MTPRALFRSVAFAEAVTWTLLIIGMFLKYVTNTSDLGVRIGGGIHGFVFLCYIAVTCFLWVNQRWSVKTGSLTALTAILPYVTIPMEKSLDSRDLLGGGWRLAAGGDSPRGMVEHVQAWVLRRPLLAVGTAVVAIAVVFSALLSLGPPTQWFA
ncbi:DUF3817 domain-containing protein [Spelaeicoccus albus]|uniref:Integral membrane protein n=1 Tax=Spelaeicoccus albus TaxID=1280376 RepID=A0A7Z0D3W5_9MICO|nr:DUF3817 domain-containing protein [Spelaeicoccus albus]NYI68378.1 integral membrane protein [Spelaeicoccus albus]